jgi:GDP-4-dehydro-6-deoxy-D-mannose reductase
MAMNMFQPDVIFHLASQSFVPTSYRAPIETINTNVVGTTNILEACTDFSVDAIHFASTSEVYGNVLDKMEQTHGSTYKTDVIKINEMFRYSPASPYGASKASAELICMAYNKCYDVPVYITRAFNHFGVRRGLQFVSSVITRQIARIMLGMSDELKIGSLTPRRDFTDVRDIIDGYFTVVEKGKTGRVYNLGSGKSYTIGELIEMASTVLHTPDFKITEMWNRKRDYDVYNLVCDYSRAKGELGWEPTINIRDTLTEMVKWYVEKGREYLNVESH